MYLGAALIAISDGTFENEKHLILDNSLNKKPQCYYISSWSSRFIIDLLLAIDLFLTNIGVNWLVMRRLLFLKFQITQWCRSYQNLRNSQLPLIPKGRVQFHC